MTGRDNCEDHPAEVFSVPNSLGAKARLHKDGDDTADPLFTAAENVVAEQASGYRDRALETCAAARKVIDAASVDNIDAAAKAAALDRLYGIAHDMKGQGTTFGYPLATEIAGLICTLLVRRPHLDAAVLKIIQAQINGLGVVLEQKLTGDGGPLGRQLVNRLRRLAERARL